MSDTITLKEFLHGETLHYKGFDKKATEATYRVGVGVFIERKGKDLGTADVADDLAASRLYYNLIGR